MRRLRSSFFSSSGTLELTRPSTTVLPFGTWRSGSKPPARSVSYSRKKASTSTPVNTRSATKSAYAPLASQVLLKLPRQVWTATVMSSGTSRIAAFTGSAYIAASFFGSSPSVQHGRRRHGEFRRALLHHRLQELEVIEHARLRAPDPARQLEKRRLLVGALERGEPVDGQIDAVEAVNEVDVPPVAAELAVGDRLQADVLLQLDGVLDAFVLHGAQRRTVDLALLVSGARGMECLRAQQAADVVGAERGFHEGAPTPPVSARAPCRWLPR